MKRRLMNGVAGTLALSVALAAGGAANATTRVSSAQRHSPAGPRPSAYRMASTRTGTGSDAIEASATRTGATRTTTVVGSRTITRSGATFTANGTSQPPVLAQNSAKLLLTGCVIRTTAASADDAPVASAAAASAPAAGAAVAAKSPSLVALNGCAITTDGAGASGVVSAGRGSFVRVANSTIRTNATGGQAKSAHGALAVNGGHVALDNVNVRTAGLRAAALGSLSDGTVIAHDGSMSADGSPVIRSAGLVQVFGVKGTASRAPAAAVVEGTGTIDAVDAELTGSDGGILFTDSSAGIDIGPGLTTKNITARNVTTRNVTTKNITAEDVVADPGTLAALTASTSHAATGRSPATASLATCNLTGGSLTALAGPAFDVRRTTAKIAVRSAVVAGGIGGAGVVDGSGTTNDANATVVASVADGADSSDVASVADANPVLIRVAEGGRLAFSASGGALYGDVISHGVTSLALRNGAALTGAINGAALDLDSSSTWSVTGPSTLTALTGATVSGGTITAITGSGHDVYYDPGLAANDWLAGEAYPLAGGGTLRPRPTV